MNAVRGRIVGKESGRGVANLVVECFDLDARASVGEFRKSAKNGFQQHRRIGSAVTDAQGSFSLDYTPQNGSAATAGANLILAVSGPEDPARQSAPLHISRSVRWNAGPAETYLVRIPEAELEKAGVLLPGLPSGDVEPVSVAARRALEAAQRDVALSQAQRDALKVKVDSAQAVTADFRAQFLPALESHLSRVTAEQARADTFVARDASVAAVNRKVIETDLAAVINSDQRRKPHLSRIALTARQVETLRGRLDQNGTVSDDDLDIVLGRTGKSTRASYLRDDPLALVCREMSDHERICAGALNGAGAPQEPAPTPAPGNGDMPGPGIERIEAGDIPRYLARLVDTMTSPEEGVLAGLEPRASQGSVTASMQDLAFKPSPADTTAFHDFHHLQVAFRHVWQEAIDEGVISLSEAAYNEIVMAGGAPQPGPGRDPVRTLMDHGKNVLRARNVTAPVAPRRTGGPSDAIGDVVGGIIGSPPSGGLWDNIGGFLGGLLGGGAAQIPSVPIHSLPSLLAELGQRLQEPYAFTTFAANRKERSVNFGALVSYRMKMQPIAYQAGKLAKTITLAPKEIRKYTKTVKRHRKRAEKEVEKHLSIRKDETTQTSRAEQEIIRKANTKTNFTLSSEATGLDSLDVADATPKTSFEREAAQVSESVKKNFHESVLKATQELTDELTVEINTEESEDFEETESGEISNPNDELAVTFLFYELQRRYRVTEHIHRLTPVVLVAQEMPAPHEINESWLVSHDWILRRVLLDDSFEPALTYLSQRVVGDQVALDEMRTNITQQRQIIATLKEELTVVRQRVATYRNLLEKSLLQTAARKSGGGGGLFSGIPIVGDAIDLAEDAIGAVGDLIHPDMPDVGGSRQDTLKDIIQRTADEERDVLMRLEREVTALNALTETYTRALAENFNQRTQILRLRTHVKQNILHYMQAIWNHEPPDQRYLRLHEVPVPTFRGRRRYRFDQLTPVRGAMNAYAHRKLGLDVLPPTDVFQTVIFPDFTVPETKPLAQVANLDTLLGYFGNCMIFPLKQSNPLTDFMMEPYLLQGFDELTDPDDLGNWTLEEFIDYVCCLKEKLPAEQFEQVKAHLKEQYERLIKAPRRNGDIVTIPTGSLFIEALPATASLIERFKAIHRAVDVKKAQAEARHAELENLRLVDRLLHGEREDPDIERKVVINGSGASPSLPVDDPP